MSEMTSCRLVTYPTNGFYPKYIKSSQSLIVKKTTQLKRGNKIYTLVQSSVDGKSVHEKTLCIIGH
jgi:hypothetical protein